ncbi:helix-turn-helix transcriptional regulator [Roseicella aquatilis]|uniref:AlpA family phage regulatory protein n=1 Tax=Roseicella aquatilis TaxID=2527868 RepID=A0A4R4D542_9PROT|nr:AlpA family phage regulatory protein [Roseicella aquatilis]
MDVSTLLATGISVGGHGAVVDVIQAAHITGLSRSSIYRLMARGEFAPRVRLSPGRFGFLVSDLIAWAAARRAQPIP